MTAPAGLPNHPSARVSLAGRWDAWLRGAEDALAGGAPELAVELPANWWLRGIDHAGLATFAREIEVDGALAGRRLRLRFGGVDYRCRAWLDGSELGSHEGYFEPFWFDLPPLAAGTHRLVVEVDSPNEPWGTVWHMHKTLIKGVLGHHDARPGNGWSRDGQARNSGGIWGPVTLEAWPGPVIVDELLVRATPAGDGAEVELVANLASVPGAPPVATASLTLQGPRDAALAFDTLRRRTRRPAQRPPTHR